MYANLSEEDINSLSSECHHTYEVPAELTFDGEGCFTFPVRIRGNYIRDGLCDSGANSNLMSLTKEKELGNLKMYPYPNTIGYSNGHVEPTVCMLQNCPMNIRGFDFCLDIVITDTRDRYDFPLILGRKFFAQGGLVLDGEQGKLPSKSKGIGRVRCDLPKL